MCADAVKSEEALAIIAETINEAVDDVRPDVRLEQLEGWDSMAVLLLMAEFDERFDIVLDEERIVTLETIDDVLNILRENDLLSD